MAGNSIIADDAVLYTCYPRSLSCKKELIMQRGARILSGITPDSNRFPELTLNSLHMAPGAALYIAPDVLVAVDTLRLGKNAVLQAAGSTHQAMYNDITLADNGILVI